MPHTPDAVQVARNQFEKIAQGMSGSRAARQRYLSELTSLFRLLSPHAAAGATDAKMEDLITDMLDLIILRLRIQDENTTIRGLDLDLSDTRLQDISFSGIEFIDGTADFSGVDFASSVNFLGAQFLSGEVIFDRATFHGSHDHGPTLFSGAMFGGARVSFKSSVFSGGISCFDDTTFYSGVVRFDAISTVDTVLSFVRAAFVGTDVSFRSARIIFGSVEFANASVSEGWLAFDKATLAAPASFDAMTISGGRVTFDEVEFASPGVTFRSLSMSGGVLSLSRALVVGGTIRFDGLTLDGGSVLLDGTQFVGGSLHLSAVSLLSGSLSFLDSEVVADAALYLPWGTFRANGGSDVDSDFDGATAHEFFNKTATYRPGSILDWGNFSPVR